MAKEIFVLATVRAHLASNTGSKIGPGSSKAGNRRVKGMGKVISLRAARKKAERKAEQRRAAANRLLHGRSKAERNLQAAREDRARRDLDLHRVETGDER
jgi:Domain of unknown function (DUF4169)